MDKLFKQKIMKRMLKDNMCKYKYTVLNHWKDLNDVYVNYVIENLDNNDIANVVTIYKTLDINYENLTADEINDKLLVLVKENSGKEFNLPKVSELSSLLKYVYNFVCDSEANMCYIDENDWKNMKIKDDFEEDDINVLRQEIIKYNLGDYLTIDKDGYKICGYGGLQCCFNDDIYKGNIELQR